SMTTLIKDPFLVLPGQTIRSSILVQGERIASIGNGANGVNADRVIDAKDLTVYPGYVDIHNHGAVGIDINDSDAESLLRVAEFLAKNGVTAWVPTLVPDSDENYRRVIAKIDGLMELQKGRPVSQAVGVHYE